MYHQWLSGRMPTRLMLFFFLEIGIVGREGGELAIFCVFGLFTGKFKFQISNQFSPFLNFLKTSPKFFFTEFFPKY